MAGALQSVGKDRHKKRATKKTGWFTEKPTKYVRNPRFKPGAVFTVARGQAFVDVLEKAFHQADTDGTYQLSKKELFEMYQMMLPGLDDEHVRDLTDDLFGDLDLDKDNQISWYELKHFFCPDPQYMTAVDNMVRTNIEDRAPTKKEGVWYAFDIDTPQYTQLPKHLPWCKRAVALTSNIAIIISIANYVAESTFPAGSAEGECCSSMWAVEATCIAVFTVEFFVRVASCPSQRLLWANFYTWVDVLAILPFYVSVVMLLAKAGNNPSGALVVLRVLRLLRLLRLLKLGRNFESVQVMIIAVGRTLYPLLISMVGINTVAVLLFASLIYTAEVGLEAEAVGGEWRRRVDSEYPDAGNRIQFQSIPDSMWWAWVTITTVGYGDMYPRTGAGKAVGAVTMMCGMVLLAFPLTLLASSFGETMEELKWKKKARHRTQLFQDKVLQQQAVERLQRASDALAFAIDTPLTDTPQQEEREGEPTEAQGRDSSTPLRPHGAGSPRRSPRPASAHANETRPPPLPAPPQADESAALPPLLAAVPPPEIVEPPALLAVPAPLPAPGSPPSAAGRRAQPRGMSLSAVSLSAPDIAAALSQLDERFNDQQQALNDQRQALHDLTGVVRRMEGNLNLLCATLLKTQRPEADAQCAAPSWAADFAENQRNMSPRMARRSSRMAAICNGEQKLGPTSPS